MSFSLFAEMYRNMTERTEERTWRALIQNYVLTKAYCLKLFLISWDVTVILLL